MPVFKVNDVFEKQVINLRWKAPSIPIRFDLKTYMPQFYFFCFRCLGVKRT